MPKMHIALQALQAVTLMPCKMVIWLSRKVVSLHLDNSIAKAYLCNQGSTASLFLLKLACHILSLADKFGITVIPAYILTYLNVEADYLSQGRLVQDRYLLLHMAQAAFHLWS